MTVSIGYKLIIGFVTLIIGVVLISVIASQTILVTDKTVVLGESDNLASCMIFVGGEVWSVNESDSDCNFTVTNNPTGWKVVDCPLTDVVVDNLTTTYTEGADYNLFDSLGVIQMLNTSTTQNNTGNTTYTDYTYCADGYLNSSFGRSSQNLVPGFFALALLAVSLSIFYSIGRETGLI